MDQDRFDRLARGLASDITRRAIVRNLTAVTVGGILVAGSAVEVKTKGKRKGGNGKRKRRNKSSGEAKSVAVCHYDEGAQTWVLLNISQSGWDNGHAKHEQDFRLSGDCCSDGDCAGGETCQEGACVPQCTGCSASCPGDPENNPTKTISFAPIPNPDYCAVIVNLAGFAGCTSHTAEYWSAINPSGSRAQYYGDVTLGPTDRSGSSQTDLGVFAKGGYLDIRFAGDAPDFQWSVDC